MATDEEKKNLINKYASKKDLETFKTVKPEVKGTDNAIIPSATAYGKNSKAPAPNDPQPEVESGLAPPKKQTLRDWNPKNSIESAKKQAQQPKPEQSKAPAKQQDNER